MTRILIRIQFLNQYNAEIFAIDREKPIESLKDGSRNVASMLQEIQGELPSMIKQGLEERAAQSPEFAEELKKIVKVGLNFDVDGQLVQSTVPIEAFIK